LGHPVNIDVYGVELYGCTGPLDDAERLGEIARHAVEAVGATVLTQAQATYQPHGVTVALILAESHLVIATWPEHGYAMVDLMLCNPSMNPEVVAAAIIEELRPTDTRPWRAPHRIGPTPE
jgi:S-adenosylmethionine decarboxylase